MQYSVLLADLGLQPELAVLVHQVWGQQAGQLGLADGALDTCHVMLDTCQARGTHGVLAPRVRAGDAVAGGQHLGPRVLGQALDRAALVIQRTITYRYLVTELAAAPQAHHLSSHTIQEADFAFLLSEK